MSAMSLEKLVAPCGIYCGACKKYIKGKCPGCSHNEKATWCKLRICVRESGYNTCAECTRFDDIDDCRKFNNFMSRIFSMVFRSDRKGSLVMIGSVGLTKYAQHMEALQQVVKKRKS